MTHRILIADSSAAVRRALRAALDTENFVVNEASDLEEALEHLHTTPHEVALVDVRLPGGAFDLLDSLKTDPDLTLTSVVLLSEDTADVAVEHGLDLGATDCLRTSADPVEVVARTRAALRVSELQQKLREGNERLTELAATDDLTGLLARRFLESHLRGLVAASARHGRPLSVVMIDLDNFKSINDQHGHPVGDFVLRTAVNRMRSRIRQEDLLGRWGGDELMLVLPDVDLDGAIAAAEGLRQVVADTAVSVDGERIPITISAGAATWDDESAHDLIERADGALYDAKAAGRDCVYGDRVPGAA